MGGWSSFGTQTDVKSCSGLPAKQIIESEPKVCWRDQTHSMQHKLGQSKITFNFTEAHYFSNSRALHDNIHLDLGIYCEGNYFARWRGDNGHDDSCRSWCCSCCSRLHQKADFSQPEARSLSHSKLFNNPLEHIFLSCWCFGSVLILLIIWKISQYTLCSLPTNLQANKALHMHLEESAYLLLKCINARILTLSNHGSFRRKLTFSSCFSDFPKRFFLPFWLVHTSSKILFVLVDRSPYLPCC